MPVLSIKLDLWASHRALKLTNRCKMICCMPLSALEWYWMAEVRASWGARILSDESYGMSRSSGNSRCAPSRLNQQIRSNNSNNKSHVSACIDEVMV
eukprot:3640198-Pyramimonas_sp.AAC.1